MAPATAEAQKARRSGHWAFALRRLMHRRQAIRAAAPCTAAIVAVAESWLYASGVLCHILERTLRILDLHRAQPVETVIDIRNLLRAALAQPTGRSRYKFRLLHYADGFLTCLYTRSRPDAESRLVVIDVPNQRIATTSPPLESIKKIFVRNNQDFLYFGTHSEVGDDDFRRWVLMGYSFKANTWLDRKVHLVDLVGSDIGQCICFEIFDGYLYGLSNQNTFTIDEKDWTSYYHCFRFPLHDPTPETTQRSLKERMMRRQNAEGPIDDRWSFIRLVKNEQTGQLQILESRKEWLDKKGSGQRNYYTTDVVWTQVNENLKGGNDSDALASGNGQHSMDSGNEAPILSSGGGGVNNDNATNRIVAGHPAFTSNQTTNPPSSRWGSIVCNPPEKLECPIRDPYKTHIGDDASTGLMFTLSKCHIRSYHYESQTFLDLVDNPHPDDQSSRVRLQLRSGSRKFRPADQLEREPAASEDQQPHAVRIRQLFKNNGENIITFWPPTPDEAGDVGATVDSLDMLGKVINPPSHTGNVKGVWDERSFVYSTGSNADGMQAIVFIGFDPSINLLGLQKWGAKAGEEQIVQVEASTADLEMASEARQDAYDPTAICIEQPVLGNSCGEALDEDIVCNEDEAAAAACDSGFWGASSDADSPQTWSGYSSGDEEEAAGSCVFTEDSQPQVSQEAQCTNGFSNSWARIEGAMYRQISVGFNGLPDFAAARQTLSAAAATASA